jgi:lysophospholipase L1-like esterase
MVMTRCRFDYNHRVQVLKWLEENIQENYSTALVVYLSLLKCPGRDEYSEQIDEINESIRNFSKKPRSGKKGPSRIQFMDLNRVLRGSPEFFKKDGIHLNSVGYEKLNEFLVKQLF